MTAGRVVAGFALTLVALTGCSEKAAEDAVDDARGEAKSAIEGAELPEVNWERYSSGLQNRLDKLAENADCSGLEKELAKAERNDTEVTQYIKAQLRELDC